MVHISGKLATEIIDALKTHPIALPLVVVNLMCLLIVGYTLHSVASRSTAKDTLIAELSRKCQ